MRADLITRRPMALSLVASAAALSLAVGAAPALAAQSAAGPGIGTAVTDPQQRGSFTVGAWTDTPGATITKVSATVRDGGTILATLPELTETAPGSGRYKVPADATLKLTEDGGSVPQLGRYTIDVTIDESTGAQSTRQNAGTLDFTMRLQTTGLSSSQPTWETRGTALKGTLVGVQPGSGDQVPLSGRTVDLSLLDYAWDTTADPAGTVTTGDDGTFSTVVPVAEYNRVVQLRHTMRENGVNDTLSALSHFNSPVSRQVAVTATADKKRILPGEKLTLTGRVTHQGAPVAGLKLTAHATGRSTSVTTDADGNFTAVLTPASAVVDYPTWSVRADGFYESGSTDGRLEVPREVTVRPKITLGSNGVIAVQGTIRTTYNTGIHASGDLPVRLEFSADKRTWKTLATQQVYVNSSEWGAFRFSSRGGNGYYRLTTPTDGSFLGTAGAPTALSRIATKLTTADATPEPVKKGKTLTVTGTLTERNGSGWRALSKQWVAVSFLPKGSTKWSIRGWAQTDAKGKASLKVAAAADGYWRYTYTGDARHYDTSSGTDFVDVR
ncbi:carboxypeptidase-like regulatory domain-containing protein [Streptomyces qinzhouensis]|uniref:Carboxypeptidase regulatory-like domain-containing protein n=1 Tax=Streptomyces qinzhouensis TaxID=2599401 RepID=A0A5B8JC55_9ACTN|nr:carboxypeptidase-like regulatory domain-containing protein [Streptomyces qinzhouensis]QDY77481.1 carboxypeptidase regulatory-like domain-containing protein [Streptomyces qinzhouensis]